MHGWPWVDDGELRRKKRKRARVHVDGAGFRNSDTDRGTEFGLENVVFGFQIETVEQNLTFREIHSYLSNQILGSSHDDNNNSDLFSGALDVSCRSDSKLILSYNSLNELIKRVRIKDMTSPRPLSARNHLQ
jgi:hypothetical protein